MNYMGLTALSGMSGMSGIGEGGVAQVTQEVDAVVAITPDLADVGDTLSIAILNAATRGWQPATWQVTGAGGPSVFTRTKVCAGAPSPMTVPFKVGEEIYDGSSHHGWEFDCYNPAPAAIDGAWEGMMQMLISAGVTALQSISYVRYGNLPDPDQAFSINTDHTTIAGDRGYAIEQGVQPENGTQNYHHGHSEAELGNDMAIDRSLWYESVNYYSDADSIARYAKIVGNTVVADSDSLMAGPSGVVSYFKSEVYLNCRDGKVRVQSIALKHQNLTWPHRPGLSLTQSTSLGLTQVNFSTLRLAWTSPHTRFHVWEKVGTGAWTQIYTNHRLKTAAAEPEKVILLTGRTNGAAYSYRIQTVMGTLTTEILEVGPVTVNNGGFHGDWAGALTSFSETSTESATAERGIRVQVGVSDIPLTAIGCFFCSGPGGSPGEETYGDVVMRIKNASNVVQATVTVPRAGATMDAYNSAAVSYTLLAGTIYNITRSVGNYNAYPINGTRTINTSLFTVLNTIDEDGNNTFGDIDDGGIQLTY